MDRALSRMRDRSTAYLWLAHCNLVCLLLCLTVASCISGEQKAAEQVRKLIDAKLRGDEMAALEAQEKLLDLDEHAVKPLIENLNIDDPAIQASIISILGYIGQPCLEELQKTANSKDSKLRIASLKVLEQIDHAQALRIIEGALQDPDQDIQFYAAGILARKGKDTGTDFLIEAFKRGNHTTKLKAINIMANIKNKKFIPMYYRGLSDISVEIKIQAIRGLGYNQVSESVNFLKDIMNNNSYYKLRREAAIAIENITGIKMKYKNEKGKYVTRDEDI